MGRIIDVRGQRFGRLYVIAPAGRNAHREVTWECVCDCGNHVIVAGYSLRCGNTTSCGCWKSEVLDSLKIRSTKHGLSKHPLHAIWNGIKVRCNDKNRHNYMNYGGRGITICDEWKDDFKAFYDWSISHGWKQGLSIDRIDNDKGYSPDNCRWADTYVQANNSRHCHYITYNGETLTISQWARKVGLKPHTLSARIRSGWDIERALTTRLMKNQYR